MLRTINDLEDSAIRATDGNIGHVKDAYFDDEAWVVRYLVVDAGSWHNWRNHESHTTIARSRSKPVAR